MKGVCTSQTQLCPKTYAWLNALSMFVPPIARLSTTTYSTMPNSHGQSSQDHCETGQPPSIPTRLAISTIMIPIPDRNSGPVAFLETALSQLFDPLELTRGRTSFHIEYKSHGSAPKGLRNLKGLEGWTGSVISVAELGLRPTEYDDGDGIKGSVTTEKGGAVILWNDTASSTNAFEVPNGSIEIQTHGGDSTDGGRKRRLRIWSGTGNDEIVSPWIDGVEESPKSCGDASILEFICGGAEEASIA
jgi:hypothetical protein